MKVKLVLNTPKNKVVDILAKKNHTQDLNKEVISIKYSFIENQIYKSEHTFRILNVYFGLGTS